MIKYIKLAASLVLVFLFLGMFFFISCTNDRTADKIPDLSEIKDTSSVKSIITTSTNPVQSKAHFVAVGDNLIHDQLLKAALTSSGYDFLPFYAHIKDRIKAADLTFINLESIMAGEKYGYSGFPRFNAPQQLEQNLIDTGFNIFNMSNNHSMDKGKNGAVDYLNFMKSFKNITHAGMYGSEQESGEPVITEKNGIKTALLSYTYGTNVPLPDDMPYLVGTINKEKIARNVKKAKQTADCVIVSVHWGIEYSHSAAAEQKGMASFLASLDVDVVLGTHPHVIEPVEWLSGKNGHKTLVFYSLGNFISYQSEPDCLLGAMADFDIVRSDNKVTIENVKATPLVTHYEGMRNICVYPLDKYTEALAGRHSGNKGRISLRYYKELSKRVLGSFYTGN